MLDRDLLLSTSSVTLQRLELRRKGSIELVEGALRAVLLIDGFSMSRERMALCERPSACAGSNVRLVRVRPLARGAP